MSDLSFEVRAPLGLELATGERVTVCSWSLQGVDFPGDSDLLPKEATLSIPFQGVDIRFPVSLSSEPKSRFLRFEGLTVRQRETLALFYRSILSGRMAPAEDVITSLDTPVDLVPMEETEDEMHAATAGKSPRAVRAVLAVVTYLALAVAVFWTLGAGIYGKLSEVPIPTARIEAPLLPHLVAQSGFVKDLMVAPGDAVAAGDILVRVTTPDGARAGRGARPHRAAGAAPCAGPGPRGALGRPHCAGRGQAAGGAQHPARDGMGRGRGRVRRL
jgi:hypothetical protein